MIKDSHQNGNHMHMVFYHNKMSSNAVKLKIIWIFLLNGGGGESAEQEINVTTFESKIIDLGSQV